MDRRKLVRVSLDSFYNAMVVNRPMDVVRPTLGVAEISLDGKLIGRIEQDAKGNSTRYYLVAGRL